jgi:hypothetical protein
VFYNKQALDFNLVTLIQEIGLITISSTGFDHYNYGTEGSTLLYFDKSFKIKLLKDNKHFCIGNCMLTRSGKELFQVIKPEPLPDYPETLMNHLVQRGEISILT